MVDIHIKNIFIISLKYIQLKTNLIITWFLKKSLIVTYLIIFNKAS